MPINGMTMMKGATGITVTAGTSTAFVDDGLEVKNGIHVVDSASTNFITRPHYTFKNRSWSLQGDGTWSKGKRDVVYTQPKVLASTAVTFNVGRISLEIHPESTAAELLELKLMTCQAIMDADLTDFYSFGSVK